MNQKRKGDNRIPMSGVDREMAERYAGSKHWDKLDALVNAQEPAVPDSAFTISEFIERYRETHPMKDTAARDFLARLTSQGVLVRGKKRMPDKRGNNVLVPVWWMAAK